MVRTRDDEADTVAALARMREALALLDRSGIGLASCYLEMAIDRMKETLPNAHPRPRRTGPER